MSFLVLKAYLKLIHFDLYLARGNFAALYDKVRKYPVGNQRRRLLTQSNASALRLIWPASGTGKRRFACSDPRPLHAS